MLGFQNFIWSQSLRILRFAIELLKGSLQGLFIYCRKIKVHWSMYLGVKVPKIDVDSARRCKQKKTKAGQTVSFASIYNQGHCHGGVTEDLLNEHFHTSLRQLTSGNSPCHWLEHQICFPTIIRVLREIYSYFDNLCGEWKLHGLVHIFFPFKK